ncbi:hypothetical protein PRNP1_006776 [Phytophthora ramorum]
MRLAQRRLVVVCCNARYGHVTLGDMIHHTQSVKRGANRPLRFVKEGGADCVQVDRGKERAETSKDNRLLALNYHVDAQTKAQVKAKQTSANAATESANDYCGTPTPAPTKPIVYIAPTSSDNHRLGAQTLFVTNVLSPFEAASMLSQP